jgi:hypothetical protein
MMIDADVPGTDGSVIPTTRHWLVNGATLAQSEDTWNVELTSSTAM